MTFDLNIDEKTKQNTTHNHLSVFCSSVKLLARWRNVWEIIPALGIGIVRVY